MPSVRAAAYTLFGSLSRFGNGPSQVPFLEQIQTNFVSLLLHLNETDPVVTDVSSVQLFYGCNFVKYTHCMAVFHMLMCV